MLIHVIPSEGKQSDGDVAGSVFGVLALIRLVEDDVRVLIETEEHPLDKGVG